jgi:phage terminase small subunit
MAMKGRKPKPTSIKKLEGNPGKRPFNTKEPRPNKVAPECPDWLLPDAQNDMYLLTLQNRQSRNN